MTKVGTILLAQAGDGAAIDALVRDAWPRAFRLAYGVLGHRQAAEDAAQDALIAVLRRLPALRDREAFDAWFASIAVRTAIRAAKSAGRRRHESLEDFSELSSAAPALERLDLANAMRLCSPLERAILLLTAVGYTSGEIGRLIGKPEGTVRYELSRTRARLREALDARETQRNLLRPALHHA